MTFDELEVGKEYDLIGMAPRKLVLKTAASACFEFADGALLVRDIRDDFTRYRLHTPPPAPVVRYVYAYENDGHIGPAVQIVKADADADPKRISPVVRVELPVDPDMLARVKGGAS